MENQSIVHVNSLKCYALIDSRSMVSTVSDHVLKLMKTVPVVKNSEDFQLSVSVAGGSKLPYSGYVEVEVHIPFIQNDPICVPMLVVPKSDLSDRVPVIVGTNILRICHEKLECLDEEVKIPKQWNTAFLSLHNNSGVVRSSNRRPLTLQPSSFMTVSGMVKMKGSSFDDNGTLITENCSFSSDISDKVVVCPRVVSVKGGGRQNIPVRIYNITAKPVIIKPKSVFCELRDVKVIRDGFEFDDQTRPVTLNTTEGKSLKDLGITIEDDLPKYIKEDLQGMLTKWKSVFSTGHTDLGYTTLVEHEIKLTDDIPFKQPFRRIPSSLYEEVREHLKELLDAGAIRESNSPFSSNFVLVRKSDGSLRMCIDFRTLNKRTIRDAHSIPRIEETLDCLAGSKYFSRLDLR